MNHVINKLHIPKVLLRYIMMNFLDLTTITKLILTVKEMNILDNYSKDLLVNASNGLVYNCINGHLLAVQWLFSNEDNYTSAHREHAFRLSYCYGHLSLAKWLYSLPVNDHEQNIDIHARNDYAFIVSCVHDHLDFAQWLYSLGNINIYACNNYAFTESSGETLNWLNSLK